MLVGLAVTLFSAPIGIDKSAVIKTHLLKLPTLGTEDRCKKNITDLKKELFKSSLN